ncbi:MAG: hypothetical protein WC829_17805 [Hyphomicrobium sp.]|jgi:hypothetical protein
MDATASKANKWPLNSFWLLLSVLLNVTGIASIVDGFVRWAGFFQNIIAFYRATVRAPFADLVAMVWPAGWPPIPGWCFDVLIVWSAFFLAKNIANAKVFGQTSVGHRFSRYSPPVAFAYCVWDFIVTPFKTIWIAVQGNNPRQQPSVIEDVREDATVIGGAYVGEHPTLGATSISRVEYYRLAVLYLAFLAGALVVMLFINYQLLHR